MTTQADSAAKGQTADSAIPSEREIARMGIVASGAKGQSTIVLTNARVYGILDNGIFGRDERSIPLDSIDSVFVGWKRSRLLLAITAFFLLVTIASVIYLAVNRQNPLLGLGHSPTVLIFLIAFLLYRPRKISIRSASLELAGKPPSPEVAKAFVEALLTEMVSRQGVK